MHSIERLGVWIRHRPFLENAHGLWNFIRPGYERTLHLITQGVVERRINGSDDIRLPVSLRHVGEIYEPLVWKSLMADIRNGDVVVDVGANLGLYTIALGRRAGAQGRVIAFEPNPVTFQQLKNNIFLNRLSQRTTLIQAAVGAQQGKVLFDSGREGESRVTSRSGIQIQSVDLTTLDRIFPSGRVDLMKIDVEGYEQKVLEGGLKLLSDPKRSPRRIYIEVHPFAWEENGTTSESLLGLLKVAGYYVLTMENYPVTKIESYGEVMACKVVGDP